MEDVLEKEKAKLKQELERVNLKKRMLKEKEKQKKAKRFTEIGRLASKAQIENLDNEILLGAFLEISENFQDESVANGWLRKAKEFGNIRNKTDQEALCIVFNTPPSSEIKSILKSKNFRWNGFRKEFYGFGNQENLVSKLSGFDCKVEVVN